jgi:hypothetical protein
MAGSRAPVRTGKIKWRRRDSNRDFLLAKHALADAVACIFGRRRGQRTETSDAEGVG